MNTDTTKPGLFRRLLARLKRKPKKLPEAGEVWIVREDGEIFEIYVVWTDGSYVKGYFTGTKEKYFDGEKDEDYPLSVFRARKLGKGNPAPGHPHLAWRKSKGLA